MTKATLTFDLPEGIEPHDVIAEIATNGDGDDSGMVRIGGELVHWDISGTGGGLDIDRRQRLAAALLLMAFDLPQEMRAASLTMLEAARLCPGLTTGEIGGMGGHQRVAMLERAKSLIEEMVAEIR